MSDENEVTQDNQTEEVPAVQKTAGYTVETDTPECEDMPVLTGVPEEVETPESIETYEPRPVFVRSFEEKARDAAEEERQKQPDFTWYWILMFLILGGSAAVISFLLDGITPAVVSIIATFAALNCFWGARRNWKKSLYTLLFNIASGGIAVLITFPVIRALEYPLMTLVRTMQPIVLPKDTVIAMLTILGGAAFAVIFYDAVYIALYLISKLFVGILSHFRCKKGNNDYTERSQRVWAHTGSILISFFNCLLFFFFLLWALSGFLMDLEKDAEIVASAETENTALARGIGEVKNFYEKNDDIYEGILFPPIAAAGGRWLYDHLSAIRYNGHKTTLHNEVYTLCLAFNELAPAITDKSFVIDRKTADGIRGATEMLMSSDYCRSLTYEFMRSACKAWMRGEKYFNLEKPVSERYGNIIGLLVEYISSADDENLDSLLNVALDGLDIIAYSDLTDILKNGKRKELINSVCDRLVLSQIIAAVNTDTEELLRNIVKAVCDTESLDVSGTLLSVVVGNMGQIGKSDVIWEGAYTAKEIKLLNEIIDDPFDDNVPAAEIFEALLDTTVSSELAMAVTGELATLDDPLGLRTYTPEEQELIRTVFETMYDSTPTGFKDEVQTGIANLYKILKVSPR